MDAAGLKGATMSAIANGTEQRFRLSGVPWDSYVLLTDHIASRNLRVTYDRGEMELMSPSPAHEHDKKRLGRLVEALTEELEIDAATFGSMTCRRFGAQKGLEPDDCYWIENEPAVRGRRDINLEIDPPPDLVLEVEFSRSALNRMGIYAALRVPEVWRWDMNALRIHLLTPRRTYRETDRSNAFPFLPVSEFTEFLKRTDASETQLLRAFRLWVRRNKRKWQGGRKSKR
jgi:Uma2 family endonuclease